MTRKRTAVNESWKDMLKRYRGLKMSRAHAARAKELRGVCGLSIRKAAPNARSINIALRAEGEKPARPA